MATPNRKFQELMLYVARKSRSDKKFGRTKLNKILFRSDFAAFRKLAKSITGEKYIRLRFGPVASNLTDQAKKLIDKGHAGWESISYKGRTQHRLVALRDPDLSVFTAEEIALVDESLEILRPYSGVEVSDLSHEFPGWIFARTDGEEIPYHTAYLGRPRKPTAEEVEYGRHLAERYGGDEAIP